MREIRRSKKFKKQLERLKTSGVISADVVSSLREIFNCLVDSATLPSKYKPHFLHGQLQGFQECHVKNDLLLIYSVSNCLVSLEAIGTHADLFD